MTRVLDPCPSCSRHIAQSESVCPMCGGALAAGWGRARVPAPPMGTTRAAHFVWRLLLATSATACGARTDLRAEDAAVDSGGGGAIYGLPAFDAGLDAAAARDAGRDSGMDAARDAGDAGEDLGIDGGDIPIYGSPPVVPAFAFDVIAPPEPVVRRRARRRPRR